MLNALPENEMDCGTYELDCHTGKISPKSPRKGSVTWCYATYMKFRCCFRPCAGQRWELLQDCDELEADDLDMAQIDKLEAALLQEVSIAKASPRVDYTPYDPRQPTLATTAPAAAAGAGTGTSTDFYSIYPKFEIE